MITYAAAISRTERRVIYFNHNNILRSGPPIRASDPGLRSRPPIRASDPGLRSGPPIRASDPGLRSRPPIQASDPGLRSRPPIRASDPGLRARSLLWLRGCGPTLHHHCRCVGNMRTMCLCKYACRRVRACSHAFTQAGVRAGPHLSLVPLLCLSDRVMLRALV